MKSLLKWQNGMVFSAVSDGHEIAMDAKSPIGKNSAMTPKEFVVAGIGGCTAMDVVALLRKHKQAFTAVEIEVDVATTTGQTPATFTKADIYFRISGNVEPEIALESVHLSQTKYCGVSSMLSKAFPIEYHVEVNGKHVGSGSAAF